MVYLSEPLNERHLLNAFDCGKPELNLWLHNSAQHAQRMGTCRTTVWTEGSDAVVGYFGLAAHVIQREQLSDKIGRGSPDQIPAVLIARLALDVSLQGSGLGGALLANALETVLTASKNIAIRFAVVDAIDGEAAKFYQKHGFSPTPVEGRLVRKLSSIEADFS